jgi:hypothetical protein
MVVLNIQGVVYFVAYLLGSIRGTGLTESEQVPADNHVTVGM